MTALRRLSRAWHRLRVTDPWLRHRPEPVDPWARWDGSRGGEHHDR